jgi:hypothetical protein
MHCGKPLNEVGVRRQFGWKIFVYDVFLPGYGHYVYGMKKAGFIIMCAFLIFFTLSALDSVQAAMGTANEMLSGSSVPSAAEISSTIGRSRGLYSEFLSWSYILIWIGTLVSSAKLCLGGKK